MDDNAEGAYVRTRIQLRGIAEALIAGPQYRAANTIRLAVRPNGFGGTKLDVAVTGTELAGPGGSTPLSGRADAVAAAVGVDFGAPAGVYEIADPLSADAVLSIEAGAAERAYRALNGGALALAAVAPDHEPVLWPEHFDVAVTVKAAADDGDQVNYGVSAGDTYHPTPYAYVGPWIARSRPFWNAPFGAIHPLDESADEASLAEAIAEFFRQGAENL
jgi:hypothetical protein